ncbi:helix-turn-helix domain-containing protein [Aurantimonas sp. Leaf443]|uniref:MerR family transcriptional regulator n=1 Tax=Aurantimonas sp. Leaf443 TaxID=1736378 RepID=UPI0006FFAAB5|nr:helix-turn-helix domain-containing protein [Aurantimonas sp. Leaf443]KQT87464.1 MerR family transcriptional regulator [Aurantimonas sp. Leaf443]
MADFFSIGRVAEATGCKVPTIRFYEEIGLLPEPERTHGNQRRYVSRHVERLRFVMHARELGLPLGSIRRLIDLSENPTAPCAEADAIAREQLGLVREKIARLRALEAELERVLAACDRGVAQDCAVLQVLSEHETCRHGHGGAAGLGEEPDRDA